MKIDPKELAERLISGLNDFVTSDKDFEKYEKEMLEHMRNKYGIELQVDWSDRTVYENNFDSWNCSLKGTTDESKKGKIVVVRWRKKKDYPYEDNYYPNVIVGEIENRVRKVLDDQIGEYKIYTGVRDCLVDNKFCSQEQLNDYLEEIGNKEGGDYYIAIFVPDYCKNENKYIEFQQKIADRLKLANIGKCFYNVYFMNEKEYGNINNNNYSKINDLNEKKSKKYNKRIREHL